ncbi:general stress protein 39 [Saitoella complicata NRRL Y-17804]|uniref:general stress protein 39 n=1 Tax=Saitoella complicata (strain BCRC 22490 / CBS 7301 / JCM 7358 / NBRC 10748 / NRRL Y-17804) TaxID=698492 RepID=UPI00086744CB|nr:general stress protein 39 [Saitoella complicata NRRL Y-17804]ODQ54939.1 general stress protein 39 [Saitoella complicata NRRL Y-17804]
MSQSDQDKNAKGGAFTSENIPGQQQNLPGLEKNMAPTSESTRLEGPTHLLEYVGVGKLRHKSALITGGDSGIGRAVAALFARESCDCSIVYLPVEQEDAEKTKELVEKEGRKCLLIPFDLSNFKAVKEVVDKHVAEFGGLNILVNNASRQVMVEDLADIDLDVVEGTFKTNIIQMIALAKFALPHLSKGDSIINTTSVTAYRGSPAMVDYASTKGAIVAFTRSLAKQLGPKGIRVNAVAPGPIHTPLQPASRPKEQMEEFGGGEGAFGRAGQPSEVAPSYVFLASAEASFYTGQVLHPNGGLKFPIPE